MKPKLINVLFLSQWYPNRYDSMLGLFVQKHAEAVSLYCRVKVLYIQSDENINNFELEERIVNNLSELIVYYPASKRKQFRKIYNSINYCRAYRMGYKHVCLDGFKPNIIHANILTRTAFVAYLFKLWKGIPYVVTEHWSRYLPNRNSFNGTLRKLTTRLVVKNAKAILPVSENLKQAMLAHKLLNSNYITVNNVVDDFFFNKNPIVHRLKKRIIHVSCFDEQAKNVKGILRATYELSKKRQDFELILIGTGKGFKTVTKYAGKLDFSKNIIHFLGEKTPEEVANWMQNSDFLVVFSNFENIPVVISESLASGIPVVSTNVGGISEHINDSNGILIRAKDEQALLTSLDYMLDHYTKFDHLALIAEAKEKYSYHSVGKKLFSIYSNILSNEI
jgi:glycosyltransferase involved in cell wall biosynthesis